jgi:hypothetical protein
MPFYTVRLIEQAIRRTVQEIQSDDDTHPLSLDQALLIEDICAGLRANVTKVLGYRPSDATITPNERNTP